MARKIYNGKVTFSFICFGVIFSEPYYGWETLSTTFILNSFIWLLSGLIICDSSWSENVDTIFKLLLSLPHTNYQLQTMQVKFYLKVCRYKHMSITKAHKSECSLIRKFGSPKAR